MPILLRVRFVWSFQASIGTVAISRSVRNTVFPPRLLKAYLIGRLPCLPDETHSRTEQRLRAIGKTAERRAIFVVFTLRRRGDEVLIRPISARYMHDKEVKNYEKENPNL